MNINFSPLYLAIALGLCAAATQANGQTLSQEELTHLVQEQALKIEQLEARLHRIESPGTNAETAARQLAGMKKAPDAVAVSETGEGAKISWSKGAPQFSKPDGTVVFRPRGRLLVDASSTSGSSFADRNLSGTEVRSARLGAEGKYGNLSYAVEGDFADNTVAWKSAYVAFDHGIGTVKGELTIGNRLNDRGIDGSSGGVNIPFAERNVVGALLLPQRGFFGVGLTERVYGKNWHASLSVAGNDLSNAGNDNDSLTVATRFHWNPILSKAATVHLGAWAFHENIAPDSSGIVRSSAISGHFNDQVKISPGNLIGVERGDAYGAELGGFLGKLWATGEWGQRELSGRGTAGSYNVEHDAWAISGGWFPFDGRPAYVAKSGAWGKVKVSDPVTSGGRGVWELRARYDHADYRDFPMGGSGRAWTVGANWYLNNFTRLMLDVINWETANASGAFIGMDDGLTVNSRLQVTF